MNLKTFIIQQAIVGAIINAIINGAFGWVGMPDGHSWPLFGLPSLSVDIVAMAFGIGFGTGLVLTPQMRKQLVSGKVKPPALPAHWVTAFGRWPASGTRRGVNVGVLAILICALPVIGILYATSFQTIDRANLAAFKAVFGAIEGAVVTVLLALAVVGDAQRMQPASA